MLLVCLGLPHSRNEPCLDYRLAFADGFVEGKGFGSQVFLPSEGNHDLWTLAPLVNLDSIQRYDLFSKLLRSLAPGQEPFATLTGTKPRKEFADSFGVISEYADISERIARNEKQSFSRDGLKRMALARHFSVIGSLNPKFVANQRLWKSTAIYLEQ